MLEPLLHKPCRRSRRITDSSGLGVWCSSAWFWRRRWKWQGQRRRFRHLYGGLSATVWQRGVRGAFYIHGNRLAVCRWDNCLTICGFGRRGTFWCHLLLQGIVCLCNSRRWAPMRLAGHHVPLQLLVQHCVLGDVLIALTPRKVHCPLRLRTFLSVTSSRITGQRRRGFHASVYL
jgi:hypothetical protein